MWQQDFNGLYWHDMPGQMADDKKINFALYRRGLIQLEEAVAEVENEDGGTIKATVLVGSDQVTYFGKRRRIQIRGGRSRFGKLNLGAASEQKAKRQAQIDTLKDRRADKRILPITQDQRVLVDRYRTIALPYWLSLRERLAAEFQVSIWTVDVWMGLRAGMPVGLIPAGHRILDLAVADFEERKELCKQLRGRLEAFLRRWGRGGSGLVAHGIGVARPRLVKITAEMERVKTPVVEKLAEVLCDLEEKLQEGGGVR